MSKSLKYEAWQDDEHEREVNAEAERIATDKLEHDHDFLMDAVGSLDPEAFLYMFNHDPLNLKPSLVRICQFWSGIREEAESNVSVRHALKEDELDKEQQALEADEAAYASKYGGY